jgi:hypothetical protein
VIASGVMGINGVLSRDIELPVIAAVIINLSIDVTFSFLALNLA